MVDCITVLGSTGSVGRQALDIAEFHGIRVAALASGSDVRRMEEQVRKFRPKLAAMRDSRAAEELSVLVADTDTRVIGGTNSAAEAAAMTGASVVVNAVTGIAGLCPTLSALDAGKDVALANKETMVAFGNHVMEKAKRTGRRILPVDSEHCAIFQCLAGNCRRDVKKLILTASGGPFFGRSAAETENMTANDALCHPTWKMGPRITVDCATMMNKGFEVIEAARLFDISPERIEVVIHRESIIHSMVEYNDNAVIAQMSVPDMRLCVQYALTCPRRADSPLTELDLTSLSGLTFHKPDGDAFPLLPFAYRMLRRGGLYPAVMNAADEIAVGAFLDGKIRFGDISRTVMRVTEDFPGTAGGEISLSDIEQADAEARIRAKELLSALPIL